MKIKPYNLLSYQKSLSFSTYINEIVSQYCRSINRTKNYFSKFLPYSDSQFEKYLNPKDDTKDLKATDLIHIFDNVSRESQFDLLDWFGQNYDFTIIDNEKEFNNQESLETLLLKMTSTNGKLSNEFLEAVKDDVITEDEKHNLQVIAIQFRSLLRTFENRVKEA